MYWILGSLLYFFSGFFFGIQNSIRKKMDAKYVAYIEVRPVTVIFYVERLQKGTKREKNVHISKIYYRHIINGQRNLFHLSVLIWVVNDRYALISLMHFSFSKSFKCGRANMMLCCVFYVFIKQTNQGSEC